MFGILIAIVIVGAAVALVEGLLPMPPPIKMIIRVVAVIIILILLFRLVGIVLP